MVNSISNGYGAGAINILNTSLNGSKPGEFKPKTNAVTNIQTTLSKSDFQATQRVIYNSALKRLEGIRQGVVQPNPDREWEVVGAFLAATGQPFKLKIDQSGQLNVEAQAESKLSEFSQVQQLGILNAIQSFDKVVEQIDLQETKDKLLGQYGYANQRLELLEAHLPKANQWEHDFELYTALGQPVQIGLNGKGDIVAINQLEHDFSDYKDADDRLKLITARNELKEILLGNSSLNSDYKYFNSLNYKTGDRDYRLKLKDDGEVVAVNQLEHDFAEYTDENDRLKLIAARDKLKKVLSGDELPTEKWEHLALGYKSNDDDYLLKLDSNGKVEIVNQSQHDFAEYTNEDDRLKLIAARDKLSDALNNKKSATKPWQYLALGYKAAGDDYLLALNDKGEIAVRRNLHRDTPTSDKSLNHIIPDFLTKTEKLETTADWQKQAAELYRAKKPFYFDYDQTGRNIIAQQIDLTHAMGLHKPVDRSDLIIQAQLSILV